jgi:hypothetical protein
MLTVQTEILSFAIPNENKPTKPNSSSGLVTKKA